MKELIIIIAYYASLSQAIIVRDFDINPNISGTICGRFCSPCKRSRYRNYDGSCNNLDNPRWGTPFSAYARMSKNSYSDGIHKFPRSCDNEPLMNPRDVSLRVSPDVLSEDPYWTMATLQWGQIVAHDMSLTAGVPQTGVGDIVCCTNGEPIPPKSAFPDSRCAPIQLPEDDQYNTPEGNTCINFVRTQSNIDKKCGLPKGIKEREEPLSQVTSFLDLSITYGNSVEQSNKVRAFKNGMLASVKRKGQEWPPQTSNVSFACDNLKNEQEPCYFAGDVRVNQNPQLALFQSILLRDHNRIARQLSAINPHWNDEKCFQETRRLCIAKAQHATYNEFLHIILGTKNLVKNALVYPNSNGYVNDYDAKVNPQTLNEHATAAFRSFHSLIVGLIKRFSENRKFTGQIRLSDWYNRPSIIEKYTCGLALGLTTQHQNNADRFYDDEIFNYFFRPQNVSLGQDMHAIDLQRSRDHGVGSYVSLLQACGFPKPRCFDDLKEYMTDNYVELLKRTYKHIDDIELAVGGLLETHVNDTLVGPTFQCIITKQFYRTRVGDRYFYENGNTDGAFTLPQLNSIRKTSIARLFCDNVKGIKSMQPNAFARISEKNALVPCNQLPEVDLQLWKEDPNKQSNE